MTTDIAHRGSGFDALRGTLQLLPQRMPRAVAMAPAGRFSQPGWIERLAKWAERQPVHHRLGSYVQLR